MTALGVGVSTRDVVTGWAACKPTHRVVPQEIIIAEEEAEKLWKKIDALVDARIDGKQIDQVELDELQDAYAAKVREARFLRHEFNSGTAAVQVSAVEVVECQV